MGLFGNKKEEIYELPSLPSLDNDNFNLGSVPESPPGLNGFQSQEGLGIPPVGVVSLPNLPSSNRRDFNQERIKEAVSNPSRGLLPGGRVVQPIVAEPFEQGIVDDIRARELPDDEMPIKRYSKKTEPIYVRLDKFETTVQSFEEIKNKIFEIEKLLSKIKEIKVQEERELNEWEIEVRAIRARIDSIDKDVFGKLD